MNWRSSKRLHDYRIETIPYLIEALKDVYWTVRLSAASALKQIDPQAEDRIREAGVE